MASSSSDVSDRAAAAAAVAAPTGSPGSLSNPELASLPAAELVVRLYNSRRGSEFADAAFVLAERERRLAEAEAQIRRASEREARLQAEVRACERRSTEPGELLPADVRGPDLTVASVGHQLEGVQAHLVGTHASRASEVEVAPLDCTASAVEAAAGVLAMLAEAAADLPRPSPLRTTAADALILAPAPQRESECNKENEDSRNSGHGLQIVPLGHFADATSVASEDNDDYARMQHLTESQMWEEFHKLQAHVSAWESELNAADGGTPTTPTQEAGRVVCESEAEAEAVAIQVAASETEERLRAEITACKEKAHATQAGLWAEILARDNAIQDLKASKSRVEEDAQRQARAASMTEAQLRDEIAACKRKAAEAEASHRAEMKACEDRAAAAIAGLQEETRKRDRLAGEVLADMEDKLVALEGYHTAIENGLRISIQARELMIQYLFGSGPSLGDEEIEAMGAQQDEQGVSGRQHTGGHAAAASSSRAQASGQQ